MSLSLWFVLSGFELLWYGMVWFNVHQREIRGVFGLEKRYPAPSAIGKIPRSPASKQIALISMMRRLARL